MSGHNRWSKIKNKKLASDARKSKGWAKQLKAVALAASVGIPDPASNPSLRAAMDKAKQDGIPNDTIARSVKKAPVSWAGRSSRACSTRPTAPAAPPW